ncbi:kinase-like domain-containing protein [Rhizophagus irregularis DAOM 181602=DAOM 197198]|uniref:Pkh1p n=2 Tax=Rhizophagus irregularis TaxID=588596 RepID=A0A015LAZ7_RHIIW|nr:Pkh1p [Rhizophagus irregularis DAOM 197198w]GBC39312.1 kinase-like domain-containing protein [Rhizophagus irregularis DAOM 181602=DAOM 197198]
MDQSNEEENKHGWCVECQQINTGRLWCRACNSKRFQQNFSNWTSGNDDVDKFIQNCQLLAKDKFQLLEWIPYDRFYNIKYVAKGGFGKVYSAIWKDGHISHWNLSKNSWERRGSNKHVALKSLNNSQNITLDFINEIIPHVELILPNQYIGYYGISQDPDTKDYIIVLTYAGKLQNYFKRKAPYNRKQPFDLKLRRRIIALLDIVNGLKKIHEKEILHRNLHVGNILVFKKIAYITDMGLCKPTNYKEFNITDNSVYGVLPYVAPEILRGQPYTKESDIYSFGIIMYEVISGIPPYNGIEHNEYLALKICEGLRPRFSINVPQLILHLIKRCLDANPLNRPDVKDLSKIFHEWLDEFKRHNREKTESTKTELIKQIEESEKINNSSTVSTNLSLTNELCSKDIYTSKLLNFNNLSEPKNSDDYYENYDNISSILL